MSSSFWSSVAAHMQQITSIIGTAAAVPTVGAALSGAVSWQAAVPVLVGSALAVLLPEKTNTPASTQPAPAPSMTDALGNALQVLAKVASLTKFAPVAQDVETVAGAAIAAAPAITSAAESLVNAAAPVVASVGAAAAKAVP